MNARHGRLACLCSRDDLYTMPSLLHLLERVGWKIEYFIKLEDIPNLNYFNILVIVENNAQFIREMKAFKGNFPPTLYLWKKQEPKLDWLKTIKLPILPLTLKEEILSLM